MKSIAEMQQSSRSGHQVPSPTPTHAHPVVHKMLSTTERRSASPRSPKSPDLSQTLSFGSQPNSGHSSASNTSQIQSSHSSAGSVHIPHSSPPYPTSRASKRTSSSSNDLLYERDRFRARLQNLNTSRDDSGDSDTSTLPSRSSSANMPIIEPEKCDVCDGIELKTTKLNIKKDSSSDVTKLDVYPEDYIDESDVSPLDPASSFYKNRLSDSFLSSKPLKESLGLTIKTLTLRQVKLVFDWYFNKPLPSTNKMFPWLHGLNKENFAQKQFFVYQQQQLQLSQGLPSSFAGGLNYFNIDKPEGIRFLMCINADEYNQEIQNPVIFNSNLNNSNALFMNTKQKHTSVLKNTLKLNEILRKIDVSKFEISNIISDIFSQAFSKDIPASILEIFKDDCVKINHLPIFLNLDPDRGVSLRNFHIQVAKLATCSDFLLYGSKSSASTMESCARLLWLAQRYEMSVNKNSADYNVFISNESFDKLLSRETSHDDLKSLTRTESKIIYDRYDAEDVDSTATPTPQPEPLPKPIASSQLLWENDYQIKEKIETTRMSSATRITKNVWIGNYWDYQIMMTYLMENNTSYLKHYSDQQESFHTTSDLRNIYCGPTNSIVTNLLKPKSKNGSLLDYLSLPKANWRLFVYCHNGGAFPDLTTLSTLLFKFSLSTHRMSDKLDDEPDYTILEFPPSGSIGIGDCKKDNLISMVNTCKLIYLYSSSTSEENDVLSSLIYCSDGYTESSLLVLCYIIYSQNVSLQDAMLLLHMEYGRPFYIFNSDVTILKKLAIILRGFSPLNPTNTNKINWSTLETLTSVQINEILLTPSTSAKMNSSVRLGYIARDDEDDDSTSSDSDSDSDVDDQNTQVDWVKEVEGSIPSRILPYLYLGSLKHANCLPLLNKLGIKKIISVGEQLDWLNGYKFQANNDIIVDEIDDGNIELYNITPFAGARKNSLRNHHSFNCSIESVMKVNNLQDDGIDELTRSLPNMLKYINDEYESSGGEGKILIHCRVGVSRSATVVIAEIMRRLNISLPDAYLYVRVRRLNIIIQPNLRFMYELFKWEEQEKQSKNDGEVAVKPYLREIDWFMMCREIMKLNIPYLNN